MSLTTDYRDGEQREDSAEEEDASEREERGVRNLICVVCQRPLARDESRRYHGEPVHAECGAELRCGVSVGPSFDD